MFVAFHITHVKMNERINDLQLLTYLKNRVQTFNIPLNVILLIPLEALKHQTLLNSRLCLKSLTILLWAFI